MIRMPEGKDRHVFLSQPSFAILRVGERAERNRHLWTETKSAKSIQGALQIGGIELKDQVQIKGCPQVPMKHYGNSANHQITDRRLFQGRKHPLNSAAHR